MAALNVITVSYNVRGLLDACLASVLADCAGSGIDAHLLVVDNASNDGSSDMTAERYPQATLIRGERNLGFGAGANRGLSALGYPSGSCPLPVLLLNPDTEVRPRALRRLLSSLDERTDAGVIGPGLIYADGAPQHAAFAFPGLLQAALDLFPIHWRLTESRINGRYTRQERLSQPFRCDHVLGAAMLFRPEAIADVGLFDESFFMYCEEIDWCWRAAKLGWQAWSDPGAVLVHHAGRSTSQAAGSMYVELWRSRYRLMRKHGDPVRGVLMRRIVRLGMAQRRRESARARAAGAITPEQHAASLAAYAAVEAL